MREVERVRFLDLVRLVDAGPFPVSGLLSSGAHGPATSSLLAGTA